MSAARLVASQPAPPPRPKPQFPLGPVIITRADIQTLIRCLPKPGTEEYAYHRD